MRVPLSASLHRRCRRMARAAAGCRARPSKRTRQLENEEYDDTEQDDRNPPGRFETASRSKRPQKFVNWPDIVVCRDHVCSKQEVGDLWRLAHRHDHALLQKSPLPLAIFLVMIEKSNVTFMAPGFQ